MSTTISPPATLAEPTTAPQRKPGIHNGFGPLLRRLHFYAGIFVAPFLFLVALTGLAYAFTPQIDRIAYHDKLYVTPSGQPIPLAQQVAAAQAAVPGGILFAIRPAATTDTTTKVDFSLPELGDKQHTVYIDPYTGDVRGAHTTSSEATPIGTWLDQMHSNLNLGDTGRLYSELAASWLWVLVLGGLILWWRHRHGQRTARRLLFPETQARQGVRRTRSWHAATGAWIAVVLLFLSATGLTWSEHAGATFDTLRASLHSDAIPLNTSLDGTTSGGHHGGGHHSTGSPSSEVGSANIDAIAASAATAGMSGPLKITPAEQAGYAWTVTQTDNTWPVHRDKIAVHPATGEIIDTVRWADQPLLSKLTTLGIQAHMGVLFGLPNQIALAAVALALMTIIVFGYRMWWQRRPTRHHSRKLGTPPARGTWRHTNFTLLFPGTAIAAAIGWAIPLLGLTLLGFLLIDAAIGLRRQLSPSI